MKKRRKQTFTLFGKTVSLNELVILSGLSSELLLRRISKGATPEEAIAKPKTKHIRIGDIFGTLVVKSIAKPVQHKRCWICVCNKCKRSWTIFENTLKSTTAECRCVVRLRNLKAAKEAQKHKWFDYTNHIICESGSYVVGCTGMHKLVRGYREYEWLCQCWCGNRFKALAHQLRAKKAVSCGHCRSEQS